MANNIKVERLKQYFLVLLTNHFTRRISNLININFHNETFCS